MHHETIYVKAILDEIKDKENLKEIEIDLGELAGISKSALYEPLKKISGVDIKINLIDSLVKCGCGYKGRAKIKERMHDLVIFSCPPCGDVPEVINGSDIKIKRLVYF